MANQKTFQRYELKFMLNQEQKEQILQCMEGYMKLDEYGRTMIRNLYFDTDTYRLIRHSLEKPVYKEKLRVRSYQQAKEDTPVFVELKKKYQHVVYKRRLVCSQAEVMKCFGMGKPILDDTQIGKEIQYFWEYYETLHPVVFLSYEREAYYTLEKSDFRVTFDNHILYRTNDLSLESEVYGNPILENGQTLMEIKTSGGIPLWMSEVLSKNHIYKTSFSKYGTAYLQMQNKEKELQGGIQHV